MRTFGSTFTTEKAKRETPAPFMTVVYRFAEGDLWLSERGRPATISGNDINPIIMSFGQIGTAIERAPEIVDVGDTTMSFVNFPVLVGAYAGRRFSDCLGSDIEAVPVDFYLNFADPDDPDTVLASEIFASGVSRFNFHDSSAFFDEEEGGIAITSLTEKWWQRNVLREATVASYPNIGDDAVGGLIPLPLGDAVKVTGIRLDALDERFTLAESIPGNPVTGIGQLYWNGEPFGETNIAVDVPEGAAYYNFDLENGISSPGANTGGFNIIGGSTGLGAQFINPADAASDEVFFFVPFVAAQDTLLTSVLIQMGGPVTPTTALDVIVHVKRVYDGAVLCSRELPVLNGAIDVPLWALIKWGFKHEVEIIFSTGALAGGYSVLVNYETRPGFEGEWATASLPRAPMHTFPGIVGPTIPSVVGISWTGIPLGPHGNLASDADPLGVSAATGQLLSDDINVPEGIVLAGVRIMLRVPATPDERMTGDLTIEISELLLDGSTRSVASATITSDQFAEQVAAYFGATEYVAFHVPVEEATYLAPGHYMVQVTNVVSRQQVEQQAAATIDEDNVIFRAPETTWRFLSFSSPTPTPPPTPGRLLTLRVGTTALFAPTTPPASKPALGVDSAPIKMQIALDALTFSRSFSAPVQLVEGTDGPFEVASVRPEDPIYGVDGTRSVPIPQGVVISGDVTCTYSRCDQVFHALATRAGIPDDRIDLAGSFASSGTKYGAAGYRFDGAVTVQQTYKALFARLGFESRSVVDWQWDQMQLKWTSSLSEVTSSAVTFSRANMLPKRPGSAVASLKIKRTPETEIVNVIPARWKLDLFENKYRAAERFDSPPSIAAHGELAAAKGVFDFLYVRDNAMIASVCANKLERGAFSKRLFQWGAFLDALGLEKDTDAVDFDMSTSVGGGGGGSGIGEGGVGEGGWGGGSSAFAGLAVGTYALIEQVSYTWQNFKTILFQAREL